MTTQYVIRNDVRSATLATPISDTRFYTGGRFRPLPSEDRKIFVFKRGQKKIVSGKDPISSLSMTAIQPLVSACYEPQETLDASPCFTLPSSAELHGMLERDNAGCCHIDHQTWGPLVVWIREADRGTESNYPKTKLPEATTTYSVLLLRYKK